MESLPVPSGGDQNRRGSLLAMIWTEATIATIVVLMRMYSRFKIKATGTEYVFLKFRYHFRRESLTLQTFVLGTLNSEANVKPWVYHLE